jgi:hypothetical protein
MQYYGEDALEGQNPFTAQDYQNETRPATQEEIENAGLASYYGFNPNAAAEAASSNLPPGPESWQPGYDTLLKQMGAIQGRADVYKRGSPLSADRHMQNIAKTLAKDYGINSIGDIGVRYETRPAYETGSDESRTIIPEEQLPVYYNKKNDQVISAYGRMFGSENEGDGYSEYNFQPITQADGSVIALPVQQYSKSGMGAFAQDIAPIMPVINMALLASGVPPLTVAAGNVALQAGAGNIKDIGDVLRTAAPVFVGDPGILGGAAKAYMAYNAFDKGDVLSGLSSLAAAAGFNGLANDIRFVNAVKTGNVPGALTTLSRMSGLFSTPLKNDAGEILRDADGVVQTIGNFKLAGGDDDYITVRDAVQGATIAANLLSDNPNYGLAIRLAGDLVGSKDTILAGKAASLIQALDSGNPSAVNNAILSLSGQLNNKAPGSAPIENRTANAAIAAAGTDLTASNVAGTQSTPQQIAALEVANANGLLASDLGTGAKLDTVNVSGSNPSFVNDDTLLAEDITPTTLTNQITSSQIAALTSGNLTSLITQPATSLAPVTVTGGGNSIGANDDIITDKDIKPTSSIQDTLLTSAQIAALTSGNLTSLTTQPATSLAPVTVTGGGNSIGANDDIITDKDIKPTTLTNQLTSSQIAAVTSGFPAALTSGFTTLTSSQIAAVDTKNVRSLESVTIIGKPDLIGANDDTLTDTRTTLTSSPIVLPTTQLTSIVPALTSGFTTLTSSQIAAVTSSPPAVTGTSGPAVLTSTQMSALVTTDPRGMMALPSSEARYWRQTGAKGTGGKGGVRFFDWYDTPENRTMAPPAMESTNISAITSQQAEAMVNPAKRYFNQSTNRYYTDPTGQWTPPAGWTQTTFKDGGSVETKHFYEGGPSDFDSPIELRGIGYGGGSMPDEDVYSYLRSLPSDNSWDSYNFDTSGLDFGNLDSAIGSNFSGGFGYDGEVMPESDVVEYLRGLPSENASWEDRNENYGNEGRAYSGRNAIDPVTGSPINAKVGVPNKPLSSASNIFKQLADAAKNNPNLTKALMAAGLGGLLGYMGRPKGIKPKGMQGGSLGLSQGQVHGALKGVPVKRAEGGEIDGYAKGGGLHYLKSAEDGMADKIPATIDNKQPAKLSGGEFVIPADVVSHLGNGNSEAGAKQLYAMMDRIRHARTGTKKQGKQVNPAKFTPK